MPIISDTGGISEYQRFGILEGKGHKKRTRGVRCGAFLGYNTLSKTSVRYKESLCEALQISDNYLQKALKNEKTDIIADTICKFANSNHS